MATQEPPGMKKVKLITSPLSGGHAARGVGFYTKHLLENLKKYSSEFDISIIQEGEADLVHYPFFDLFSPTLQVNAKTVVTIHDVIPLEFPEIYQTGVRAKLNLWRQKNSLIGVERVITDSMASLQAIRRYLNVPHHKLKLIYLAADEIFKPITNKKMLNEIKIKYNLPKHFVLYVGDINWNKNIPGLVAACKNADLPLVWVGKHALEIEKLDLSHPELRHLNGLDLGSILRLGYVPDADLVAIYNLATVYCQPSFAEGFGLPVLEALNSGTAVACSNSHSLPEIGGDEVEYFDPHNISEITNAIKNAKKPPKSHENKFSWEKTSTDTLLIYKELL